MTEQDNARLAQKLYEEFNRRDLDALMDLVADDVTYVDSSGIRYYEKGLRKVFDTFLASFPDSRMRVDRIVS